MLVRSLICVENERNLQKVEVTLSQCILLYQYVHIYMYKSKSQKNNILKYIFRITGV